MNHLITAVHNNLVSLNQATAAFDAFGRLRVGQPLTLFDSKLLHDKSPLFWNEATVSGSGFTSTYLENESAVEIVSDGTLGKFVRQTWQRFNYQPGKSLAIAMTGVLEPDDITGTLNVVKRSSTSGSPVDTVVPEIDFNGYLTGNQEEHSPKTDNLFLELSNTQIFGIDIEWLGVGQVRYSVTLGGKTHFVHASVNANENDKVYMQTPNLPLRWEIEVTTEGTHKRVGYFDDNNGVFFQYTIPTQINTKLKCICGTVISEGGLEDTGITRYASTQGVAFDANSVGTVYGVIGIRLKSTHIDTVVKIIEQSLIAVSADNFEWMLIFNPTVAGDALNFVDQDNSAVQIAIGNTTNTVTGGTIIAGSYSKSDIPSTGIVSNSLRLGASIAGVSDQIFLCVRPLGINLDIHASLTWRELI